MPQVDLFESLLKTAPLSAPVRAHVSRVYQTLLVTLATAALGALLQIRYSIGGWFTAIATLATSFWLIMTPFRRGDQQNENLRTGIVCLTAFLVGCSLGPGLKATYDTLGDMYVQRSTFWPLSRVVQARKSANSLFLRLATSALLLLTYFS